MIIFMSDIGGEFDPQQRAAVAAEENQTAKKKMEHERRFYTETPPEGYKNHPWLELTQGYTDDEPAIRYRSETTTVQGRKETRFLRVIKKRTDEGNEDDEQEISQEDFNAGWNNVT